MVVMQNLLRVKEVVEHYQGMLSFLISSGGKISFDPSNRMFNVYNSKFKLLDIQTNVVIIFLNHNCFT